VKQTAQQFAATVFNSTGPAAQPEEVSKEATHVRWSVSRLVPLAWLLVVLALVVPFLPYLRAPQGYLYLPMMSTATRDIPPYLVRIQQGMAGSLLYRSPFGGWEVWEAGAFPVNILYNLWGFLLSPFRPDALLAFHLLRLVAAALLLASFLLWARRWLGSDRGKWAAVLAFGSLIYFLPLSNYKPDQQLILSLVDTPHSTIAMAALFAFLALCPSEGPLRVLVAVSLGWLAGIANPYVGVWVPLYLVLSSLWYRQDRALFALSALATGIPLALYAVLMQHPVLQGYRLNVENDALAELAVMAGPLALSTAGFWPRRVSPEGKTMLGLAGALLLITLIFPYAGSRMFLGFTPAGILGLINLVATRRRAIPWLLGAVAIAGSLRVLAFLVIGFLLSAPTAYKPEPTRPALAYSEPFREAAEWLAAQPPGATLSSFETSNVIPYLSGQLVWVGHPQETPDFGSRMKALRDFWRSDAGLQVQFCRVNRVRWIWFGQYERAQAGSELQLPVAFRNREITLYLCQ
jgi:hypothetical protein